jgi:O-antigen/teichoic acid export membrane protein
VSHGPGGTVAESGFAQAAIRGSLWTAMQAVVNKLAAAGATFALGFLLQPTEFGAAWFAVSSALLVSCFHVIALGDVLLAYPAYIARLAVPAQRLAALIAVVQCAVILLAGVVLSRQYPDRQWLLGLMAVAASRPLSDAFAVVPLARLRRDLRFRTISLIDGTSALGASVASVLMAWLGAGPFAIVVPPIALIVVRGVAYRSAAGPALWRSQPFRGTGALLRRAVLSAFGSYVAGVLFLLETMVLGLFVPERPLGLFAFAFGLASQVNSIVSFQVAGALQPIFGHIEDDPRRQIDGLLRSCRLVAAVLVPALLVQAAVGGEFIRVAWAGKWDDAVTIFQVLSVGQALYVCQWPSAFVLKSQGRFRAYVKLQLVNIAIAAAAFVVAIRFGGELVADVARWSGHDLADDAVAPVSVAGAAVAILATFGPVTLWVTGRVAGLPLRTALDVLWRPWTVALPVAVLAGWLARTLTGSITASRATEILLLLAVAGICAATGILGAFLLSASTRVDGAAVVRILRARLALSRAWPSSGP